MSTVKNILVFCPMNPTMPRLWGQTVQSIFRMQSETIGLEFWFRGHDNPYESGYQNILHNFNTARQVVLQHKMDGLLIIESDMIVPPDTVTRLVECESDIAYGLYVFRHSRRNWSAYSQLMGTYGRSLSEDPELARAAWGRVMDVAGVGTGCTLIRSNVLEALEFSLHPINPNIVAPDWMLALDAQRLGFTQRCDLGCVCGHQSYKPWPLILWPDPEMDNLYRIETLPDPATGKYPMRIIKPGESLDVEVGMNETVEVLRVTNYEELLNEN